jgi:hypothetical protein
MKFTLLDLQTVAVENDDDEDENDGEDGEDDG